jgi:predicted RNA methylase
MKIQDDVLTVLSTVECRTGPAVGSTVRITGGQLDRKLYVQVNKVLEALGGKWSRREKGHLFPVDAEPLIEHCILTGEVTTAKDIGFFPTPIEVGRQLVELADIRTEHLVLEPSAGKGDLIAAVKEAVQASIVAVEREENFVRAIIERFGPYMDSRVSVHCASIFDPDIVSTEGCFERVVMNPPFVREDGKDHLDHVRAAHALLRPGAGRLVSVLPTGVEFREDRRHRDFREWYKGYGGETTALPEGAFASSGTMVSTLLLAMNS